MTDKTQHLQRGPAQRVAMVCVRKGSKGLPGKNFTMLHGLPLFVWSILQAQATGLFDIVCLSSDSRKAVEIASALGARGVLRPSGLASDAAPKLKAIMHAAAPFAHLGQTLVDLDATAILRSLSDIRSSVALLESHGCASVITACEARHSPYFNQVQIRESGRVEVVIPDLQVARRQDSPTVYDMNAAVYVWQMSEFLQNPLIFYPSTQLYVMPRSRSLDVDDEIDLHLLQNKFQPDELEDFARVARETLPRVDDRNSW